MRDGGYQDSRTAYFEYTKSREATDPSDYRLVLERLSPDRIYIWPVVGATDWPVE